MLVNIIETLKTRTAALFNGRVFGAAEFAKISADARPSSFPAAYVVPLDGAAERAETDNGYLQKITDAFAVIVVRSNEVVDELSEASIAQIYSDRSVLNKALLLWNPDSEHGPIIYNGDQLLDVDRAHLYYQYEYYAESELGTADTWKDTELAALSALTKIHIDVDTIDPYDKNRVPVGNRGPDGTIDASIDIDVPQ